MEKELSSCDMSSSAKKPIIGIMGGIGSGKSTVAAEFCKLGCKTISADKIAHTLLEEPFIREKIVACFGNDILDTSGNIDHRRLADIVFSDIDKLSELNSIVHPPVLLRVEQLIEEYNGQKEVKAIVLDMPLLLEVGWHKRCDRLIFVDCSEDLRQERAKKSNFFDENWIKIREKFQISLDKKASIADNTVNNNSGFAILAKQVADVFSAIMCNM